MLDHRPVVRERLLASAVFGAIVVGVVVASDVLITGGFDFPSTERGAHADTPNYFQIAAENWSDGWTPRTSAQPLDWPEDSLIDVAFYESERLVGGADDLDTQLSQYQGPSEEELRREIAELYAALPSRSDEADQVDIEDDARAVESTEAYGDETYPQAAPMKTDAAFSASGNASPW